MGEGSGINRLSAIRLDCTTDSGERRWRPLYLGCFSRAASPAIRLTAARGIVLFKFSGPQPNIPATGLPSQYSSSRASTWRTVMPLLVGVYFCILSSNALASLILESFFRRALCFRLSAR